MAKDQPQVAAIDLFCGAGGLSHGLQKAGIAVLAGVDNDPYCQYPFEKNIDAAYIHADIRDITVAHLRRLWPQGTVRMLAGCAPCQPFSPYRGGTDTSSDEQWPLLDEFSRLVKGLRPHIVTMENVTRVARAKVFADFVDALMEAGYSVDWRSCYGPNFGLPQERRRLVMLASRLGPIQVPTRQGGHKTTATVRSAIAHLPALPSGAADPKDSLHRSRRLSDLNLERIRASRPGGTWLDWPKQLRAPCHLRQSGASFRNIYSRMEWDAPSPTITTLSYNFGAGRFGHPEQDRSLTLREAAILQGFPPNYKFVRPEEPVYFSRLGRLIGNAVPPPLAAAIGRAVVRHVRSHHPG